MARPDARTARDQDKDRPSSEERTQKKRKKDREKEKARSRKRPRNSGSRGPRKSSAAHRRRDESPGRQSPHRQRSRRHRDHHGRRKSRPRRPNRTRRKSSREDRRRSRRARETSDYEYSESLEESQSTWASRSRSRQAESASKNHKGNSQAVPRSAAKATRGLPGKTSARQQAHKSDAVAQQQVPNRTSAATEKPVRRERTIEEDFLSEEDTPCEKLAQRVKKSEDDCSVEDVAGEVVGQASPSGCEKEGQEIAEAEEQAENQADEGEGAPTAAQVLMANRLSGRKVVTALSAGGSSGEEEAVKAPRPRTSAASAATDSPGGSGDGCEEATGRSSSAAIPATDNPGGSCDGGEEVPLAPPQKDGAEVGTGAATTIASANGGASSEDEDGGKRFAWMDSADEAGSGSEQSAAGSNSGCPKPRDNSPPPVPQEVETLGQMLRLAESLAGKQETLDPASLVDICAAAARVRYYDPALFQETLGPPMLRCFHEGLADGLSDRFDIDQALEVVSALARLNAASALAHVFAAAAKALRDSGERLSSAQRKTIKDVYASAGRERDVLFLSYLVPSGEENQPHKVKGSTEEGMNADGLPMRPGARICENFFKSGVCRNGIGCRNDHPEALRLTFNSEGYPIRPWVQACTYYMRMGTCDYRKTCKWHHPEKKDRPGGGTQVFSWIPKGGSMGMGGH